MEDAETNTRTLARSSIPLPESMSVVISAPESN